MNQFGISFSETAMHLAHSKDGHIEHVDTIAYPFQFSFDVLFTEQNVMTLVEILRTKLSEIGSQEPGLVISLPMNYVHIKKVAFPISANGTLMQTQAEWEFKNYLSGDIEEYKIINTKIEFSFENHLEVIFIAFKKDIIKTLSSIAEKCNAKLSKVVPVNFILAETLQLSPEKSNAIIFKFDKSMLNTQLFIDSKYYYSYIDASWNGETDKEQKLFEFSKQRFSDMITTLDQLPFAGDSKPQCYIYGDGLTPELERLFKDNFSVPAIKLVSNENEKSDSGLEAVQVLFE